MKKYFKIAFTFMSMAYKVYWSNRLELHKLFKDINLILDKNGQALSITQKRRIKLYTRISRTTNSWFSTLRGKKPDKHEELLAFYLGAITPLIDDYTDISKHSASGLMEELNSSNDNIANSTFLILKYLFQQMEKYSTIEFHDYFRKTLIAQDASLKQLELEILSEEELKAITFEKGAASILTYRMVLTNPINNLEEKAISNLGYLMQLINDMFDIYEDYHGGQQTLFTQTSDLKPLFEEYDRLYEEMILQFLNLDYDAVDIKKMLFEISAVVSRGKVCSEQLLACQEKTGGRMNIEDFSRKELICDMEKASNIVKSIKYTLKYYDLIVSKLSRKVPVDEI